MFQQRIRLLISYQGHKYYGWQKQTKWPSVQGAMEKALKRITGQDISLIGAGRTDTGAHALGQNAHFDILGPLPARLQLKKALNSFLLPQDICVQKAWVAPSHFHALHSATGKSYKYFILNRPEPCVFRKKQIYWYPFPLDKEKLNRMSQKIEGRHDFESFRNRGTPVQTTERKIFFARWEQLSPDIWVFHIKGEGFLKQMIRNLVGTQLKILRAHQGVAKWERILKAKNRQSAYSSAPAEGLYLCRVYYPLALDKACQPI